MSRASHISKKANKPDEKSNFKKIKINLTQIEEVQQLDFYADY